MQKGPEVGDQRGPSLVRQLVQGRSQDAQHYRRTVADKRMLRCPS